MSEVIIDLLSRIEQHLSVLVSNIPVKKKPHIRKYNNPSSHDIALQAMICLIEHGKPLTSKHLFRALEQAGMKLTGADPVQVMVTALWREQATIRRLGRHVGYWPTNTPLPT